MDVAIWWEDDRERRSDEMPDVVAGKNKKGSSSVFFRVIMAWLRRSTSLQVVYMTAPFLSTQPAVRWTRSIP